MKLIIAGSRNLYPSFQFILNCVSMLNINKITEVVSGGCEGVDREGEHFASHMKLLIKKFSADWDKWGKSAGPRRNKQMAQYGDALLLIWDGNSRGSASMKEQAINYKLPIYEIILKKHEYT